MGVIFMPKQQIREKATTCAYPLTDIALPRWEYVLRCCTKCTCVNFPDQETDDQHSDTTPSIHFLIYYLISCCTAHGMILLNDKKIYCVCKRYSASEQSTFIYTIKKLVMTETTISNFHTSFYIP